MQEKKKEFIAIKTDSLLNVLIENLKDLSKSKIKSLIKYQNVLVENKVVTNSSKVISANTKVCVYFEKKIIECNNIKILYEDSELIAIDKPSGLLSISTSKENHLTAYRLISEHLKKNNYNNKVYVVHRLDQDTSGVLLFAKNKKMQKILQDNWSDLVKVREYTCVVYGDTKDEERLFSYLTEDNFQKVYSTSNKKGKLAITNYKKIKGNNNLSLLNVLIETGRKNQIRVQLSDIGHTIVGDKKYGAKTNPINRLALHASKIIFVDPRNKKTIEIESQIPNNILNLVK